jgi:hypothetical protein
MIALLRIFECLPDWDLSFNFFFSLLAWWLYSGKYGKGDSVGGGD